MAIMPVILVIALSFVSPSQLVAPVRDESM
jgi:hypothetical protein